MRLPISWSDLPGRRVGIYGFGVEGRANLRAADARGLDPVLVDDRPATDTADDPDVAGRPILATADGGLDALLTCDVVIKSPGISRYGPPIQQLRANGVTVAGGLGLWLQEADLDKVLVITGTKGKSTTTSIAGHLLTGLGYRVFIGGNLGFPPQDPAIDHSTYARWVIEVSSYQATDLTCTPPVTAVTSLSEDHLPWHRNRPETYYRDKLSATSQPGAALTVINGEDPIILAHLDQLAPAVHYVHDTNRPGAAWIDVLGLPGRHNRINALIAQQCLVAMGVPASDEDLAVAARGFAGLPSRMQTIGEVGGVTFIDDGLSTNVLGTRAAVDSFPDRRVALLVGGFSRDIDYRGLADGLRRRVTPLRLFPLHDNGPEIVRVVTKEGTGPAVDAVGVDELEAQVRAAYEWAGPGGVVLLSPAAASFGRYRDYRERGAAFTAAVQAL
ncbi:UDP-N-acetylmuramoylalanine--D-glutamate ligase [Nakamurella panacisegetis]|uniref:UDP-N-acetylmuramoylalanine--D-glutamate ligase n=1 Tax=Nakamurella panacisegetis TaxID=1090615 RepID=A0A1H0LSH1_9ACTN|nr:UDP-N-acetylmuramoyl-L-alanine--D-glutamate ligase [Nakamurella panacisegetis]SDO70991.1 UDP-N-acetylmuramoylalanine--D-glutamate ligase [Nakamurella panacisegetis]